MTASRGKLFVVGAAIVRNGRCLVAQRGPKMALAGQWEFPGGKVERGERPEAALVREIREELDLEIEPGRWVGRGEALAGDREIVLDVYLAKGELASPQLTEHSQVRWISAEQISQLEWAAADRPILPILRRVLTRGIEDRPLGRAIPIVSVDWSKVPRKRAVYAAVPDADGWVVERCGPPGEGWTLARVLELAKDRAFPFDGAALVAIDAVIGVPALFGARVPRRDYPALLKWMADQGTFGQVVKTLKEWSPSTPFFAVQPGPGGLSRFVEAAGGKCVVYRQVERSSHAKTTFAASGIPGSVGSGSMALWREIAALRSERPSAFRIWPFEIEAEEVAAARVPTIAESYPRACYGVALADALPAEPQALAKTKEGVRRAALDALQGLDWLRAAGCRVSGFEEAERSEDDFDALMQAVALTRLASSKGPLASHLVDPVWEGGILGTGGLIHRGPNSWRRSRSVRSLSEGVPGRSSRRGAGKKMCPIPGCSKFFKIGRSGWDAHVASMKTHPDWEIGISRSSDRKRAFRNQFPEWLSDSQ